MKLFAENYIIGFKFFDKTDGNLYEVLKINQEMKFKIITTNGDIFYYDEIDIHIETVEEGV